MTMLLLMAMTLFLHAQCMRVHLDDGWTEQIEVSKIDSITFSDSTHLAPTLILNNGLEMPVCGIGTYSLHNETCFNAVYRPFRNVSISSTLVMWISCCCTTRAITM